MGFVLVRQRAHGLCVGPTGFLSLLCPSHTIGSQHVFSLFFAHQNVLKGPAVKDHFVVPQICTWSPAFYKFNFSSPLALLACSLFLRLRRLSTCSLHTLPSNVRSLFQVKNKEGVADLLAVLYRLKMLVFDLLAKMTKNITKTKTKTDHMYVRAS